MNKRIILAQLAKIANELDKNKLFSEANDVTNVMKNVEKKKGSSFFDLPGVFGGPRFGNEDQIMEQFRNETTKPKPPIDLGPFLPDFDGYENFETDPDEEFDNIDSDREEDVAVIDYAKEDKVIVCYPGPLGKRYVIDWNVKGIAFRGQEILVDWERRAVKKILPTSDEKRRMNIDIINTKIT